MLFSNYFNPVFTIFALSINLSINLSLTTAVADQPEKPMDDITNFRSNTYCKFQANRYKCGRNQRGQFRYYYNSEKNTCEPFQHGNCFHHYNTFTSLHACKTECKEMNAIPTFTNMTENIFCRLQPEFGTCNSYNPRWYFDISEMTCRGFSYSGCGGNRNNFDNSHKCMDTCGSVVKQCKQPSVDKPIEILTCYT